MTTSSHPPIRAAQSFWWKAIWLAAAITVSIWAASLALDHLGWGRIAFGVGTGQDLSAFAPTETRTSLYPLFVSLGPIISYPGIIAIQVFLYVLAGLLLLREVRRLLPAGRLWTLYAGLLGGGVLLNPRVVEYALSISEEGLFVPLLMALLAASAACADRP